MEDKIKRKNLGETPNKKTSKVKHLVESSIPNKKKKLKKSVNLQSKKQYRNSFPKYDSGDKPTNEKHFSNLNDDSYRPGMISNLVQIKKYGQLIMPWDPSFGLDSIYRGKYLESVKEDFTSSKLEVNPLFDLSRQNHEHKTSRQKLENAVFVGNLPDETKIIKIKKLFRKFGLILHAKLRCKEFKSIKKLGDKGHNTNKQEGKRNVNALIQFSNHDGCEAALRMNGELYKGHHLRVTLAKDEGKSDPAKSVFVGNLAFRSQDEDLWKAFEDCGAIESVRVVRDIRSGKGKGYGYINFKSADSVEPALKLNGTLIIDRNIRVSRNQSDVWSLSNNLNIKRRKTKRKLPGINPSDKTIKAEQESKPDEIGNENSPGKPLRVTQKLRNKEELSKSYTHKKVKTKKTNGTTDQLTE